ncbi:MAG: class I SAM-dependent methyltransferase [Algoriphagus sp.]|uniref:class I SAM-dependent methyltransferase n=1 Tax=Algoriphagus sp. TaxID=1872435 RepID=UPI0026155984|nr:class I SAM-dependent methyltransferase [Algoriphagus sp.]MDG1277288.1 class I SAM-dependent methyltransferase [Algoriphagus sp.]
MNEKVYSFLAYLSYWLKKEDKYALQSPLLYNHYKELFKFIEERKDTDLEIEEFRNQLLQSQKLIPVLDLGAGSKKVNSPIREVAKITKYSTSNRKYAQLLQYFCAQTPGEIVIELGTCVGITTRYLSKSTKTQLLTFEASEELIQVAKSDFKLPKVKFVKGNINFTLPEELRKIEKVDFAFIDANHTYEGTMKSFKELISKTSSESIIAIGDIHWSKDMEKAWKEIQGFSEVKLSLDFYEVGILFFQFPGKKTHLILDF